MKRIKCTSTRTWNYAETKYRQIYICKVHQIQKLNFFLVSSCRTLSLPNPLKPGVKSRMKVPVLLEQQRISVTLSFGANSLYLTVIFKYHIRFYYRFLKTGVILCPWLKIKTPQYQDNLINMINPLHAKFFHMKHENISTYSSTDIRDHFAYAPSQWEMMLHCNVISHWLGAYTKWSLWYDTGSCSWNPSSCKTKTHLFYMFYFNIMMGADVQATQGARPSTTIIR